MTKLSNIVQTGEVIIKGKSPDGKDIEFTADFSELVIDSEQPQQWVNTYSSNTNFSLYSDPKVTLTLKLKRGKAGAFYTIRSNEVKGVERTARVEALFIPEGAEARDLTVGEVLDAADKAGVPSDTEFSIIWENNFQRKGKHVFVEFKWTE